MPALDEPIEGNVIAERLIARRTARPQVCIITTEFHGLFKNGGIGTANTGLAVALAQSHFDVTVAFADADENGPRVKEGNFDELRVKYRELGITLDFVPASPRMKKAFDDPRSASYCVYLYLKKRLFDVVYFNDCGGHGYYSLLAKRLGVFPKAPTMYVVAHGPHEWVLELNSMRYWDRWPVITSYLERRCAALADALISPSQYLLDWMTVHGWVLSERAHVIPNIVWLPDQPALPAGEANGGVISELVFFGRIEVRKGVELFCDAIDVLHRSAALAAIRITFMGKFAYVAGLHSGMYVVERARRWRSSLRILPRYGQEEALAYLRRPGVLAVVPSLAENSPCVVAECLQLGIPFVATDSGGTAELVAAEDQGVCLVAPDPQALATRLSQILKSGQRRARPATCSAEILSKWIEFCESDALGLDEGTGTQRPVSAPEVSASSATDLPLVSVCLTHCGRSRTAKDLLDSVFEQNYPRLELLMLNDGSDENHWASAAVATLASERDGVALRFFTGTSHDRGAARNKAAAEANGRYLFFVEEEAVILKRECLQSFVRAALATGADIVTGMPLNFSGWVSPDQVQNCQLSFFPIGACAELGAFENCFGKGVILVDRLAFERSSGFETRHDPEIEDWLFLASSVLSGLRLEVVPEQLFWYLTKRSTELNRSRVLANHRRILDAYSGHKIELIKHMLETMVNVDRNNNERLREALADVSSDARETALRVSSSFEPNHEDALRGLVQFCIERQMVQTALDFAVYNERSILSDAIGKAITASESLAMDSIGAYSLDLQHEVALTDDVKRGIKAVPSFPAEGLVQPANGVAAHSIVPGITILKAPAGCPSSAISIRAVVDVDASAETSLSLALVASTLTARMRLTEQGLESKDAFWWSGWVPAGKQRGKLELLVSLQEPAPQPLDLHFMCKADGNGESGGKLIWESVAATVSMNSTMTRSLIESTNGVTPVPRQVVEGGILLTENSKFPFPLFVPGDATLVHPLPGQVVMVRLAGAVRPGTKAVQSVVSIERAEAHPIQFAVWVRPSSTPAANEKDFTAADTFSGWYTVRDKFRRHRFTAALPQRADQAMDIYLATRVLEYPDVHYCHSVWHQLLLME